MIRLRYAAEAWLLQLLLGFFRLLPLDIASAIGAEMGRTLGPFFSAHHTAYQNLKNTFPAWNDKQIKRVLGDMWEHLGRVAAEYPFLPGTRLTSRLDVTGLEHAPAAGNKVLFFSGHLGNWELLCSMAYDRGIPLAAIYRHTNNPRVNDVIATMRSGHTTEMIRKGPRAGVQILTALKRGLSVAMLVDQKQNNGIPVTFFGRDAMTSPAIAELALKYDVPIVPARIIRRGGARFEGRFYPPLQIEKTADHEENVRRIMTQIHTLLEDWIREYPEQWFWVHRRWPKPEATVSAPTSPH